MGFLVSGGEKTLTILRDFEILAGKLRHYGKCVQSEIRFRRFSQTLTRIHPDEISIVLDEISFVPDEIFYCSG
jgi:hypothetical protein